MPHPIIKKRHRPSVNQPTIADCIKKPRNIEITDTRLDHDDSDQDDVEMDVDMQTEKDFGFKRKQELSPPYISLIRRLSTTTTVNGKRTRMQDSILHDHSFTGI